MNTSIFLFFFFEPQKIYCTIWHKQINLVDNILRFLNKKYNLYHWFQASQPHFGEGQAVLSGIHGARE